MNISEKIQKKIETLQNPTCLGIDPHKNLIPRFLIEKYKNSYQNHQEYYSKAIEEYFINILHGIKDIIGLVKPQLAFFEQFGSYGLKAYENILDECRRIGMIIISDSKRGDVGSTSEAYASAFLDKNSLWESDAVTVNPYLGSDGIIPFVKKAQENDKGIFVLVKTSNPSSSEIQDLKVDKKPIYMIIADYVKKWNSMCANKGFVGAVVGATHREEAKQLRKILPDAWFLVPGYGTQGGTGKDLISYSSKEHIRIIVPASRSLAFAYTKEGYSEKDYVQAVYDEAIRMKKDLQSLL